MDCRGPVFFLPEIVGGTSLVKMEGKEGKCEGFCSLRAFIDATINNYCMCGERLVDYIYQQVAPTYHFVVLHLCVLRKVDFSKTSFRGSYWSKRVGMYSGS